MLSKNLIKKINSLKTHKYRNIHSEFIVEGEKCVHEVLKTNYPISAIYGLREWIAQNIALLKNIEHFVIDENELQKISSLKTPNMVLAVAKIPEFKNFYWSDEDDIVLVLDDIKDPGNLGTIIRIADWFDIKTIICSPETVDVYNPKVIQSTMGSFVRVKVLYQELIPLLKSIPDDITVYGTFTEGESIQNIEFAKKSVIVIGSESHGVSNNISSLIHKKITIPSGKKLMKSDTAESLNAAIASAIVCYEFRRNS